jgi:hypothetical protein
MKKISTIVKEIVYILDMSVVVVKITIAISCLIKDVQLDVKQWKKE